MRMIKRNTNNIQSSNLRFNPTLRFALITSSLNHGFSETLFIHQMSRFFALINKNKMLKQMNIYKLNEKSALTLHISSTFNLQLAQQGVFSSVFYANPMEALGLYFHCFLTCPICFNRFYFIITSTQLFTLLSKPLEARLSTLYFILNGLKF